MANDDFSEILYTKTTASTKKNSSSTPYAVTGTVLKVTIIAESWDNPGQMETLDCGSFEVDAPALGGPPPVMTIKAVSVPLSAPIRREKVSKGWEDVTLREIASDIAQSGGLSLVYELDDDPFLDRIDQRQQANLPFLEDLCADHGATVKVFNDRLVVFSEAKYEARNAAFTFREGDKRLLDYDFNQDSSDVASSATVEYKDSQSGKMVEETFEPATAPAVAAKLNVNQRPSNLTGDAYRNKALSKSSIKSNSRSQPRTMAVAAAATSLTPDSSASQKVVNDFSDIRYDASTTAQTKAKAALREQNKSEWQCKLKTIGNPGMTAGLTFNVEGFGVYDGKYIADSVVHTLGGGYTTEISGHKVLEGY